MNLTSGVNRCSDTTSPCNRGFHLKSRLVLPGHALFSALLPWHRVETLLLTVPCLRFPVPACPCGTRQTLENRCPVLSDEPSVFFTNLAVRITSQSLWIRLSTRLAPFTSESIAEPCRDQVIASISSATRGLVWTTRSVMCWHFRAGISARFGLPVRYWNCLEGLACMSVSRGTNSAFH